MQHIIITGNIGGDATTTQGQRPQYRFSVGAFNGRDEQGNAKTAWYTVFAPILQRYEGRLVKGAKVTVAGDLTPEIYIGNDGMARIDLTLNANSIDVHTNIEAQPSAPAPGQGAYNPVVAAGAAVAGANRNFKQAGSYAQATRPQAPAPAGVYQQPNPYAQATQPVGDMPNFPMQQ